METRLLQGKEALKEASKLIKEGEVVAFPTETVYGLGADAFNKTAVEKIFIAKGRPSDNPLIVHIWDKSQIKDLVKSISKEAQACIDAFMPGPITIILNKSEKVPDCVTAGLDSVGIRMPQHKIARDFIKECNTPIAAPSANTSTHISPTSAKHVFEDMKGLIPLIIEGGDSMVGIESTIVDFTVSVPTILRPGAITVEMLANVLGKVTNFTGEVIVAKAPGMKYKHYAPNCEMIVAKTIGSALKEYDNKKKDFNPVIICESNWVNEIGNRNYIDVGNTEELVTRHIYGAMHEAQDKYSYIICQDFGYKGMMLSVMNRVNKASGGKKI